MDNLDKNNMPNHIGIIMDGNGRWAFDKGLPRVAGHKAGVKSLKNVIKNFIELQIPYLTLYAFSTENWKRPTEEINFLMDLLTSSIKKEIKDIHKNNIKVNFIGERQNLPTKVLESVELAERITENNSKLNINVALNYGGRSEVINGIKNIVKSVKLGKIELSEINESLFKNFLYTKDFPDPDLIIRPSGEKRLSNFLIWQSAYAELWFTKTLWPDFDKNQLLLAIKDYQNRERRFGDIRKVGAENVYKENN